MGAWKHDADYIRKAQDDEELRLYGAEQDYLHGLHIQRQSVILNADPGDENEPPKGTKQQTNGNHSNEQQ